MLDLPTLINPKYWFQLTPSPMSGTSEKVLLGFFVAVFVAGLVLKTMEKRKKFDRFKTRVLQRLSRLGLTVSGLGLLFLFFSYEGTVLFGSRMWFLFLAIGSLVWLGFILFEYYKVVPKEKLVEEVRRQKEKYLPKKKK